MDPVALLVKASALLTEYRNMTGRPAVDDLSLFEWASSEAEWSRGEWTGADVVRRAIAMGMVLWSGENDHFLQAEIDRAHDLIESLGFGDEEA